MPILLEKFNSMMNEVCLPEESGCVVLNEVRTENWAPSDFVDDGHFSRTGGIKFSQIIAKHIHVGNHRKATKNNQGMGRGKILKIIE